MTTSPSASASASPWAPPEHLIAVDGGWFIGPGGSSFTPRGTNYFLIVPTPEGSLQDRFFSPAVFDAERLATDFAALAHAGYNTVRLFLDSCPSSRLVPPSTRSRSGSRTAHCARFIGLKE